MSNDASNTYIFNTYATRPTFHAYGRIRDNKDVTACGLVMYDGQTTYAATLPRFHSELFAKPCHKCFPEAAS